MSIKQCHTGQVTSYHLYDTPFYNRSRSEQKACTKFEAVCEWNAKKSIQLTSHYICIKTKVCLNEAAEWSAGITVHFKLGLGPIRPRFKWEPGLFLRVWNCRWSRKLQVVSRFRIRGDATGFLHTSSFRGSWTFKAAGILIPATPPQRRRRQFKIR